MALTARPKHKQTISDKKRLGQHHKASKRYTKTYWPYLPMLLVLAVGFILNVTWTNGRGILGYATSMTATTLLQETNSQRSQNGQGGLSLNNQLSQAAQAKADDMAARDYWSHVTPDGQQPWKFITNAGYSYQAAGENLAYGFDTSTATVVGWMNSSEHRANILNASYQEVGFGIANVANYQGTGEQTVVVAMYAKPHIAAAPAPAQSTPEPAQQTSPAKEPVAAAPSASPVAEPAPVAETPTQTTVTSQEAAKEPSKPAEDKTTSQAQELNAKEVARIDVLTNGNAQWASLALSTIATISIISFILKHGRLWRRYLTKGEAFIIRHPLMDTALVAVGVIGFVLTRTTGFIQ
jgi:uncharacterized protein YkwD